MANIMLAPEREDLTALQRVGDLLPDIQGVKVLTNEAYTRGRGVDTRHYGYAALTNYVQCIPGAPQVMIDARIGNDKEAEVEDAVRTIVSSVVQPPSETRGTRSSYDLPRRMRKPDYITGMIHMPREVLQAFSSSASEFGVEPVIHVTSSRFSQEDYDMRSTTAEDNARSWSRVAVHSGFSEGSIICAAADAKYIKDENPDFTIFATGAILKDDAEVEPYEIRHKRWVEIEKVRDEVDVFIFGSSITKSSDCRKALNDRLLAARC